MNTPRIDTGAAVRYGWNSVKKDFWYFVGLAFVVFVAGSIGNNAKGTSLWGLIGLALSTWMTCRYTAMILSYQSGKKLPFTELFGGTKYFWRVLGGTLLVGLIVGLGTLLFVVPGIYLALKYQFTITLIIDQDLSISEAMKRSALMSNGNKMALLVFDITMFGVILLGFLALGFGVLIAAPVVWLAGIVLYRSLVVPPIPGSAIVAPVV